ncbi:SDR family oxidoreductase [Brooklawnia cerclae]|uniref:NAD(P)-dependent dehydrogenase (Short-subunit alcohol dehydrogenase family) n=1 Tax=Brooklawnia cerclae TaxID=349934 RepID=A0ABX0SEF0_9ACTN|nr:SDR family oxidoreductase [Brooklawnia cerclae]NIH56778.1 NAD(P)-dependent dehydrogenase (short-subunit alcohol dehydrogenase family) [Brooklawnia cerclae]
MADLNGTTVVVVGGSSGIGLRVAELAAERGALIILGGRDPVRLTSAANAVESAGADVTTLTVDAHDPASLGDFFERIEGFDHLVSTIGAPMGGGFLSAPLSEIRRTVESKFFANLNIARLAAGKLRDGGSLTFTSGTGGRAQDAAGSYVGNLAVHAMIEGLAVELAPAARVNAVAPTWTDTPLWADLPAEERAATKASFAETIPLGRTATIDELASAYLFLMENEFVTGQQLAVDGGIMLGA